MVNQDPKYRHALSGHRLSASAFALVVALSAASGAAAYGVRVEGLEGEAADNVEAMLTPMRARTEVVLRQTWRAQVDDAIGRALQALGYYQYEINYRWEKKNPDKANASDHSVRTEGTEGGDKEPAAPAAEGAGAPTETSSSDSAQTASPGLTGITLTYDRPRQSGDEEALAARNRSADDELVDPKLSAAHAEDADGTGEESCARDYAREFSRTFGLQRLSASDIAGSGVRRRQIEGDPDDVLVATVEAGDPVRIQSAEFSVKGVDLDDRENRSVFRHLRRKLPKKGDQLNHGTYTDFKSSVERTAMRYGYFDGEFIESELQVNAVTNEGGWLVVYDPKERYRYGSVTFKGSQIREEVLENLVPFEKGEAYSSDGIAELNRRLSATGWFNSIVVTPDISKSRKSGEKELPVEARVSPKTKNALEVGLGYSTDVGPRGKLIWKKPWINDSGHSLQSETDVSGLEQMLDFSYKLPLEKNALEHFWLFRSGYKHEDLNDTMSDAMSLEAARRWEPHEGWQKGVALKWRYDDFKQGSIANRTMMLFPEISLSRSRSRGGLMPRWGDSQRYTVGYASRMWGSEIDALMVEAQYVLIRTYARDHRFVLRSHLGWIETGDFNDVSPDLRYFAGGDRSVRGYDYESISPKDENGELLGASRLLTGSIEYQLRVTGNWWGAVFLDIGRADNKFEFSNFKKGAGVGIRWKSPLGPVKLDIARPVGDSQESGIQFYIGLGPEL